MVFHEEEVRQQTVHIIHNISHVKMNSAQIIEDTNAEINKMLFGEFLIEDTTARKGYSSNDEV